MFLTIWKAVACPARLSRSIVLVGLIVLSVSCGGAEPTPDDLARVKKTYLTLRFQQSLNARLQAMDEEALMQLSCRENYVNCTRVLEMLKEEDPRFYARYQTAIGKDPRKKENAKETKVQ